MARTSLRAALVQEDLDLEVLVVDDGSAEQAPGGLSGLDDARVRLVRHAEPRGIAAARNTGVREADGEWIAFLDDDDLWSPQQAANADRRRAHDGRRLCLLGRGLGGPGELHLVYGHAPPRADGLARALLRWNVLWGGARTSSPRATSCIARGLRRGALPARRLGPVDSPRARLRSGRRRRRAQSRSSCIAGACSSSTVATCSLEFDYLRGSIAARRARSVEPDAARFARWAAAGHFVPGAGATAARTYLRGTRAPANVVRAAARYSDRP